MKKFLIGFIIFVLTLLFLPSIAFADNPKEIYFQDTFSDKNITGWDTSDATWLEGFEGKEGVVKLAMKAWAAPYISRELSTNEIPTEESFIWHFQVYISSFNFQAFGQEKDAIVLGALYDVNDKLLGVVVNEQGHLGFQFGNFMQESPIYSNNPTITTGKWEDIYIHINKSDDTVSLFHGSECVLTHNWTEGPFLVKEIWLGPYQLGGKGNYGALHHEVGGLYFSEIDISKETPPAPEPGPEEPAPTPSVPIPSAAQQAAPTNQVKQTVDAGTSIVDASTVAGAYAVVEGSGGQTVTIKKLSIDTALEQGFLVEGATTYVDLHLDSAEGVEKIEFTILGGQGIPKYWNGSSWIECSDYTIDSEGNVIVTITNETIPSLADLTGTIFTVVPAPKIVRTHEMTCYKVFVNDNNNFEFVFWWEYKNNNWISIYDSQENLVYRKSFPYGSPIVEVDLPDGTYTVKTFHEEGKILQEFEIAKP